MPSLPQIDHLALTVADVERSTAFYTKLWGVPPSGTLTDGPFVRRKFDLAGGLTLGLTEHQGSAAGEQFDHRNSGLDHIGFGVAGVDDLEEWVAHLDEMGIEHSGPVEAPYGTALSFKDPDGIALEFFAPSTGSGPSGSAY